MALERVTLPVDAQRGVAACFHLGRALELERRYRMPGNERSLWLPRSRDEHLRLARGFLGAIGFELGQRLVTRAGDAGVTI